MDEPVTATQLQFACRPEIYRRGYRYFLEGRVLDFKQAERLDNELVYRGEVRGGRPYRVEVSLYREHGSKVGVSSSCDCPVHYDCKHGVALALAVAGQSDGRGRRANEIEGWLRELGRGVNARPAEDRQLQFLYVLKPVPDARQVVVNMVQARRLRKGGYGVTSRVSPQQIGAGQRFAPAAPPEEDRELAQLLLTQADGAADAITPRGATGHYLIRRMVNTGRTHWRDAGGTPLQWGEPRPCTFAWVDADADHLALRWRVEPAAAHLLATDPPVYLDPDTRTVGEAVTPGKIAGQLHTLLRAPPIPRHDAPELARHWVLDLNALGIPPPQPVDVHEIGPDEATPTLVIVRRGTPSEDGDIGEYSLHTGVRYGPLTLHVPGRKDSEVLEHRGRLYRARRNRKVEQSMIDELEHLSLTPDGTLHDGLSGYRLDNAGVAQWYALMEIELPRLERLGWRIESATDHQPIFTEIDDWWADVERSSNGWFDVSLDVEIDGQRVHLLPVICHVLQAGGGSIDQIARTYESTDKRLLLPLGDERFLAIPGHRIAPVIRTIGELLLAQPGDRSRLRLGRVHAADLNALERVTSDDGVSWRGDRTLQDLGRRLEDFDGIEPVLPAPGFVGTLRDYQQQGLSWLQFLRAFEFGGVLADDMGLGKTVQVLAHLQVEKAAGRLQTPCLAVVPTSLLSNWQREAARFAPDLETLVWHGAGRRDLEPDLDRQDLVITTYAIVARDAERLLSRRYHLLIADEAQRIKNPKTVTARALGAIDANHRLCLTGTPLENHLGELWSIFHFLMPDLFGGRRRFNQAFRNPIERRADAQALEALRRRIKPFMLRRSKSQVARELPEKTEIIRSVTLSGRQRELYESIRVAMEARVRAAIEAQGLAASHITILDALLKLRQTCCDPRLVKLDSARGITQSAKLELLMDLLDGLLKEDRKVLLFSQFTQMLALIEQELVKRGVDFAKLTGRTRDRDAAIDRFRNGEAPVFLISLKAGGVGLNLIEADTVIHYDPWWNPAVEDQATDRAHRIGQVQNVFVYKLLIENSVEERIRALMERKAALGRSIFSDTASTTVRDLLSADDLSALLEPM